MGLGVGGGVARLPGQAARPQDAAPQAPAPRTPRKGSVSLANELSQRALTLTGLQPPHAQPGTRSPTQAPQPRLIDAVEAAGAEDIAGVFH